MYRIYGYRNEPQRIIYAKVVKIEKKKAKVVELVQEKTLYPR
jgi:hypothetical protein